MVWVRNFLILGFVATCFAACKISKSSEGSSDFSTPSSAPIAATLYKDVTIEKYSDRSVRWQLVGGSSPQAAFRHAWYSWYTLPNSYWQDSMKNLVDASMEQGFERMVIWSPMGLESMNTCSGLSYDPWCWDLNFNAFLQIKDDPNYRWLVNQFVEYWKPLINAGKIEGTVYIGNPAYNRAMDPLISNPSAWLATAHAAIKPYRDAGFAIAFDVLQATDSTPGSALMRVFVEQLEAEGVHIIGENIPVRDETYAWSRFPIQVFDWPPTAHWQMPAEQYRREVTLFNFATNDVSARQTVSKNAIKRGLSATSDAVTGASIRDWLPSEIQKEVSISLSPNAQATYSVQTQPSHGSARLSGNTLIYTLTEESFTGTDSFEILTTKAGGEKLITPIKITVQSEMPRVSLQQQMSAARTAGAGSKDVVSSFPIFQNEIEDWNLSSVIPSSMHAKRVIVFAREAGNPQYFIVGYDKSSLEATAVEWIK